MIDKNQIESSYKIMYKRYGNAKLLQQAAQRRAHLDYDRITFGRLNGQKNYLRLLLAQAHAAYYLGSFHSCVALCGSLLEAVLQMRLLEILKQEKLINFYFYFQGNKVEGIQSREDINKMSFNDMIRLFKQKKYLSADLFTDLNTIKEIRNQTIHERLPAFRKAKKGYLLKFPLLQKNTEVFLNQEEVEGIENDGYQITAYYCISRMRRIFKQLLNGP